MSYVYAVRMGDYIKLGWTERPKERMAELRRLARGTEYPPDLAPSEPVPLFAVAGSERTEFVLKCAFYAERSRGEWFHYRGAVKAWCEAIENTSDAQRVALTWPFGTNPAEPVTF